jgi:hypothetical protein
MSALVDQILALWLDPPDSDADGEAAFRRCYTDPVPVNGTPLTAADLLIRARGLHTAFSGITMELLSTAETDDRIALAFVMRGRHTGPLATPLGTIEATGRPVENRTIDLLTISGGKVSAVWVVADELGVLSQLGVTAVR